MENVFNIMDEMVSGGFICDVALGYLKRTIYSLNSSRQYTTAANTMKV